MSTMARLGSFHLHPRTRHEGNIGSPASHAYMRMRNADVVELFELVDEGVHVLIEE